MDNQIIHIDNPTYALISGSIGNHPIPVLRLSTASVQIEGTYKQLHDLAAEAQQRGLIDSFEVSRCSFVVKRQRFQYPSLKSCSTAIAKLLGHKVAKQ